MSSQAPLPPLPDEANIVSLWTNVRQLGARVHDLEQLQDLHESPWWHKLVWVIDGWPLHRLVDRPQWRPWRRWWRSP